MYVKARAVILYFTSTVVWKARPTPKVSNTHQANFEQYLGKLNGSAFSIPSMVMLDRPSVEQELDVAISVLSCNL